MNLYYSHCVRPIPVLESEVNLYYSHCVRPIPVLESEEEADNRMLLYISQSISNVVTHTPDTNVFLIAIAASTKPPTNLFIGTENKGQS